MALIKVTTVVPDYTGYCGNVGFEQGVGWADPDLHRAELLYMRANGYTVHDSEPEGELAGEPDTPDAVEPVSAVSTPPKNASVVAWREYAVASGMSAEEAETKSRDQLVELFTTKEAGA